MDSITHIVLGAACGEVLLGKKAGNRAMIWGAIGNTIPDFDVLAGIVTDPLTSLSFHRGPMHSLLFIFIVPFILGPCLKWLYDGDWPLKKAWKIFGYSFGMVLYIIAATVLCLIAALLKGGFPWFVILCLLGFGIYIFILRYKSVFLRENHFEKLSLRDWILLFLVTVTLHPLLDSLTTFGTQLYWPFSDERVAVSCISIADPMYTIPFAIFVMLAALQNRKQVSRGRFAYIGLVLSSFYLLFTYINKNHVDNLFINSLQEQNISYKRYMTTPTILNNFLWYGIAQKSDSNYVYGYYSILDKDQKFLNLTEIKGNHYLLNQYKDQETLKVLSWFSNGFFNVFDKNQKSIIFNDLRYGSLNGQMNKEEDFIFKFELEDLSGVLKMKKDPTRSKNKREDIEWFKSRMTGKLME